MSHIKSYSLFGAKIYKNVLKVWNRKTTMNRGFLNLYYKRRLKVFSFSLPK